jgi:hypothetical protein
MSSLMSDLDALRSSYHTETKGLEDNEDQDDNITLFKHRQALKDNPQCYTKDISRLYDSVKVHLRNCGYNRVPLRLIKQFVDMVFRTQDYKPFFHIESELPYCWNSPTKRRGQEQSDWECNYIIYQWGHLRSRNQNSKSAHTLDNLCLMSARCNNHIQASMDMCEVVEYFRGSETGKRIVEVLARRKALFESKEWAQFLCDMQQYHSG